jgi:PAS domain S-box-containing protein
MGNTKDENLYIRLVEHATTHYRITLIANLVNAFILIYILRDIVPHSRLAIWFAVLLAIVAPRAIHAQYARFVTRSQARKIERINFLGLVLTGAAWGMVPLFLFPENSLIHQTFITFVIGGMVIGASVTTAALSNSFLAFSVPAMIPLISRFFVIGTNITYAMGIMLIVFFCCFALISRKLQLLIIQTIKSTLEKEEEIKIRENVEKDLRKHQDNLELIVKERTEAISKKNMLLVDEIAERKRVEKALQEIKERLSLAIKATNLGPWDWDLRTNEMVLSTEWKRQIGYKEDEVPGRYEEWESRLHPEDRERVLDALRAYLDGREQKYEVEFRLRHKDGSYRWIYTRGQLLQDENFKPYRMLGCHVDITERKLAEENIKKSEDYIRNILDTVDEGFIVVDRDYRIITANKSYCDQVSRTCDEVVGRHCYEVSHQAERPCFEEGVECAVREAFSTGKPRRSAHKHFTKDEETLFVETKAFPNMDESGNVTSVIETIHNVTERHLLEVEQLKTQKLEAIGTLAGGIAHDFNNLLQGVFGYISMAKLSVNEPEEVSELLDQAEKALTMSTNLTTQLLTFAKGGKPVIKNVDLRPTIKNAAKFALSGSNCGCRFTLSQELYQTKADEGQVAQVIQNIVLNASEAMPDGGSIDISADNVEIARGSRVQLPDGGQFIRVTIKDTGVGISQKHLSKIFDPYFTTKHKGSGLGLATSYSIVKNHGGMIDVQSEPGIGTEFHIYLPAAEVEKQEPIHKPEATTTRKCRILVMDDEEVVRNVAQKMITALGHEIELATDGESAIEKYRQAFASGNPFDLVILDLTIKGGMGGEETVKRLLEMDPNVKTVVASGYSDYSTLSNFQAHGFSAVLSKPFTLDELRECLNALV